MVVPTKKEILDFSPINRGEKEELPAYKRKSFFEVKKLLESGLIVAITGLRRVGKTTLMKQLLEEDAFFFSFDEKRYTNPETLKRVVEVFLEEKEKPLIALDEIFRVDDWAGILKRYHDQKKARFILSGSSSLMVKKGVESLSGRLLTHYLPPLQFDEYLELKGESPEKRSLGEAFKIKKRYEEDAQEFLKVGSFPEIVKMDEKTAVEYIRTSTVEKIVFDDIPSTFRVENPSKLYDLVKLCATASSRLFTEVNFAEALQISRHAISDYLLYLGKAYLVDILYPMGSFQKALKKQKKIFVKTASIYNALAENPTIGQAVETAVYDKLSEEKISFYTDPQKREIDFIWDMPVEVKYQTIVTREDMRNLLYYMKKYKKGSGLIVTKDLFDEKKIDGKRISFIPLDVFLLAEKRRLGRVAKQR
ncbi:MAG: ATP-binding protein [Candidatus Bilamarchaeaceae archaeon]